MPFLEPALPQKTSCFIMKEMNELTNQASELTNQASEPGKQTGEIKTQAGLHSGSQKSSSYRFLQAREVEMIDEALSTLGDFGEVRLVIERGRLRFLITQHSFDAYKWRPGSIAHTLRK